MFIGRYGSPSPTRRRNRSPFFNVNTPEDAERASRIALDMFGTVNSVFDLPQRRI